MSRLMTGAFAGLCLVAFAAIYSSTNAEEKRPKADVEVNRNGVKVNVDADRKTDETHTKTSKSENILRGKDLMGLNVYGENDEKVGDIQDLVIDPAQGKIRYAVLSFGGFLGMGDKYFAVPWSDLEFVSKGTTGSGTIKEDHCILAVNKEDLRNAPGFDKSNWPNFADRNWSINVDKYYNERRHTRRPDGTMR